MSESKLIFFQTLCIQLLNKLVNIYYMGEEMCRMPHAQDSVITRLGYSLPLISILFREGGQEKSKQKVAKSGDKCPKKSKDGELWGHRKE